MFYTGQFRAYSVVMNCKYEWILDSLFDVLMVMLSLIAPWLHFPLTFFLGTQLSLNTEVSTFLFWAPIALGRVAAIIMMKAAKTARWKAVGVAFLIGSVPYCAFLWLAFQAARVHA